MKIRRVIAGVMIMGLSVGIITGCQNKSIQNETQEQTQETILQGTSSTDESTMETQIWESQAPDTDTSVTMERQVIYDDNSMKVTVTGMSHDDFWGASVIHVIVENDSKQDFQFSSVALLVNGYGFDTASNFITVGAGEAGDENIYIYDSDLANAGMTTIECVEWKFCTYDEATSEHYVDSDLILIKTKAYTENAIKTITGGEEIYADDNIVISVLGQAVDEDWNSHEVVLKIENMAEEDITLSLETLTINGIEISEFFNARVVAGRGDITGIMISDDTLEDNEIEAIERIGMTFNMFGSDNWTDYGTTGALECELQ